MGAVSTRRTALTSLCLATFLVGAAATWFLIFTWMRAALHCPPGAVCKVPLLTGFALGVAAAPIGGGLLAWLPCRALKRANRAAGPEDRKDGSSAAR